MKTKNLAFALYSCRRERDSEDAVMADRSLVTLEGQRGGDTGWAGGSSPAQDTQPGPPVPTVDGA